VSTQISVRYYKLHDDEVVPFEARLKKLAAKPKAKREINIADNEAVPFYVRLEELDLSEKPLVCGQFVRRTLIDHPPEATKDGLLALKLGAGSGLGYPAAFAYLPKLKVIALEYSPRVLSLSRVLLYVNMSSGQGKISARPIPNQQAWDRYAKGKPRKLTITLANPENLAAVEGDVSGVLSATSKLNEIFDAPVITIEVSMGHKKGSLNSDYVEKILNFFTVGAGRKADVRNLRASVRPDDGSKTDDLDFLSELLTSRNDLDISDDPVKSYEIRKAFVRTELKKHIPYIKQVYGAENG